jgi:uncharacterized protein YjbJ (UPF0337 family)
MQTLTLDSLGVSHVWFTAQNPRAYHCGRHLPVVLHKGLLRNVVGNLSEWKTEVKMSDKSGPAEGVEGVVEGVKGKVKEAAGAVIGRDDLREEGQAQQDKADAQRDAAKKEAEAESARKAADANEERQRAHQ